VGGDQIKQNTSNISRAVNFDHIKSGDYFLVTPNKPNHYCRPQRTTSLTYKLHIQPHIYVYKFIQPWLFITRQLLTRY